MNGSYARFEALLKEKNITAYRVAKDTGIATATLSAWKNGGYMPKIEKLMKIAKYFDVPIDCFLESIEFLEASPKSLGQKRGQP